MQLSAIPEETRKHLRWADNAPVTHKLRISRSTFPLPIPNTYNLKLVTASLAGETSSSKRMRSNYNSSFIVPQDTAQRRPPCAWSGGYLRKVASLPFYPLSSMGTGERRSTSNQTRESIAPDLSVHEKKGLVCLTSSRP